MAHPLTHEFMSFTREQKLVFLLSSLVLAGVIAGPTAISLLGRLGIRLKRRLGRRGSGIELSGIWLSDDARMRHTHIIGATGTGKTVLMEHLLYRDLARGYGALIIDPKGEREFYERIKRYCISIGRESDLHLLSAVYPDESERWNPCRLGSAAELQSKFFCASKYDHEFYAKAAELALLQTFSVLDQEHKSNLNLTDLVAELESLSNGGKDENLKGLYFDIQNLSQGEWAPIFGSGPKPGLQSEISLLDITRKNEILFVDLPTEGKSVQSSRVGALLLQELTLISGLRKRMPDIRSDKPFSVFVDEFDAFATESFISFLNKGRSSEFMIHLAHQTLSDLEKISPTFLGQVMGNPNVRFIFRVDLPHDAERLSKLFGTRTVTLRTAQTQDGTATGMGSSRSGLEFRIHPDDIKTFGIGECVLGIKTEKLTKTIKIPRLDFAKLHQPKLPIHRNLLAGPAETLGFLRERPDISEVQDSYSVLLATLNPSQKETSK